MKDLNLATLGVEEMSEVEIRGVDGGLGMALLAYVCFKLCDEAFAMGVRDGQAARKY